MALLRPTPANIEFFKRQLRQDYPQIGSAHRAEAFAAACGFRTYASLLAALRVSEASTKVIRMDEQRWSARLAELGYKGKPDDRLKVCLRSLQLPDPCWMTICARYRTVGERWFRRCRSENLPYITVQTARKYATLEWDCITLDTECDGDIREDHSRKIVDRLSATFQRRSAGSGAKPYFSGSAFVGSIKDLRPDIADLLADEFFMILYQASRPSGLAAA